MSLDLFGETTSRRAAIGSHQSASGGADEWLTPRSVVEALGPFDLDPCAPIVRPWPTANRHYTIEDNGLTQPWHGLVWCNPPYSENRLWLSRLADHGNGIALVFARAETRTWHEQIWGRATAIFFPRGRLTFCYVDGRPAKANSGAPSAFVAYGPEAAERLSRPTIGPGALITTWHIQNNN